MAAVGGRPQPRDLRVESCRHGLLEGVTVEGSCRQDLLVGDTEAARCRADLHVGDLEEAVVAHT